MKRINRCLNHQLATICQKSMQIDDLNLKLSNYLPAHLAQYCKIGSFNQGCLTIVTSEACWATELRYALPELRDNLRTKGNLYQLISIKIQIMAEQNLVSTAPYQQTHQLSQSAKNTLQALKEHLV